MHGQSTVRPADRPRRDDIERAEDAMRHRSIEGGSSSPSETARAARANRTRVSLHAFRMHGVGMLALGNTCRHASIVKARLKCSTGFSEISNKFETKFILTHSTLECVQIHSREKKIRLLRFVSNGGTIEIERERIN